MKESAARSIPMPTKSILLIDDDEVFRSILAGWLRDEGWKVTEAGDGEVGLALALELRPDVVLCDLLMPRVNGFQVVRTLRAQAEIKPQPKIIVTTGSGYATDRANAGEAGADEYLIKPIKPAELVALIRRLTETPGAVAGESEVSTLFGAPGSGPVRVKFWGVRGSIPTPGPHTAGFGGNTSCVEIRGDGELIICDAGTGIRPLGQSLVREFPDQALQATILISHTHWDHIQGFPFFAPAYNPKNRIRVLGFEGARRGLETTLSSQMESPYFPISLRQMPGNIIFRELKDLAFKVGAIDAQAQFMNHPGVCVGYRLTTSCGTIAYLPDNEPYQRQREQLAAQQGTDSQTTFVYAADQDRKLVEFLKQVDVAVVDTQYTEEEYKSHVGWGHGCVEDVIAIACRARVKKLFLFHHDPDHDDVQVQKMVDWARELVYVRGVPMEVDAAREGLEVVLPPRVGPAA
jgi:phosphoribosyl 1,2-cyclic phosphodiesterase/CheY-like chemotaxis protein